MAEKRPARVADEIRRQLAKILSRKVSDPRLALVSITDVEVTRDLRLARVYYQVLAGGEPGDLENAKKGLDKAKGYLKRELASMLYLRYMPDLEFRYDDTLDRAGRVDELLKQVAEDKIRSDTHQETGGEGDD